MLPQSLRKKQQCQPHHPQQYHQRLKFKAAKPTQMRRQLRQHPHHKKIPAHQQQNYRGLQDRARRVNVNLAKSMPNMPNHQQNPPQ